MKDWIRFSYHCRNINSFYGPDGDFEQRFLAESLRFVVMTSPSETFYRARLHGPDIGNSRCLPADAMLSPPPHLAKSSRVSPAGIPCLYMCSDPWTAVAETRPWRGAVLSVALIHPIRTLNLVELSPRLNQVPRPAIVQLVDLMMAEPAHQGDPSAYAATQRLASLLKAADIDGLTYGSAMNPVGFNTAAFNAGVCQVEELDLYRVDSIAIDALKCPKSTAHDDGPDTEEPRTEPKC